MCAEPPPLGNPAVDDQRLIEKPRLPAKGPRDSFFGLGSHLLQDSAMLRKSSRSRNPSLLNTGPAT